MKIPAKSKLKGGSSRAGVSTFADSGTQTEPIALIGAVAACNSRSTQTNPRTRSIFTKSSRFSPVALTSAPDHVPEDGGGMLSSVTLSGDRAAITKNRFRGKRRGKIHRFGPRRPLGFAARTAVEDEPVVNIDEIAVMLETRLGMTAAQPKAGVVRKSTRSAPPVLQAKLDTASTSGNPPKTILKSERANTAPPKVQFGFNPHRRLELGRNPLAIKDPIVTNSDSDVSNWSKALIAVQSPKSVQVETAVAMESGHAGHPRGAATTSCKTAPKTRMSSKVPQAAKKSSLLLTFLQDHSSSLSFQSKDVKTSLRNKRPVPAPTPKNRSRKGA